jgi:microcystin-dependent protein
LRVRSISFPDNDEWFSAVLGALSWILNSKFWEGRADQQEPIVNTAELIIKSFEEGGYMIGSIVPYVRDTLPSNVLYCDGSFHNRADYPELSAVISGTFSGYDPNVFQVPDLRGRFLFGDGETTVVGTSVFGDSVGNDGITLTADQLPSHAHSIPAHVHSEGIAVPAFINGGLEVPASAALPSAGTTGLGGAGNTGTVGSGNVINNYPPYTVIMWGIVAR